MRVRLSRLLKNALKIQNGGRDRRQISGLVGGAGPQLGGCVAPAVVLNKGLILPNDRGRLEVCVPVNLSSIHAVAPFLSRGQAILCALIPSFGPSSRVTFWRRIR